MNAMRRLIVNICSSMITIGVEGTQPAILVELHLVKEIILKSKVIQIDRFAQQIKNFISSTSLPILLYLIFYFLELPSFLARPNKLCSDDQNGYETLESLEECKMAANYLPKPFAEEQSSSRFPKGCYFSTIDNQVYYNSHSTGDKDFNARPICRAKGKVKILW